MAKTPPTNGAVSRRKLLAGGALAGLATWLLKPGDRGQSHAPYFEQLSEQLRNAGLATPRLVIDSARLNANIDTLTRHIGTRFHYRVVAKSLPSVPLLAHIMARAKTHRLMVFHQPFLNQVAQQLPHADVLMGKPMPVQAAHNFYRAHGRSASTFNPSTQLQWLVDTPERLAAYGALADTLQQPLCINIELDVGLHRGGVTDLAQLDHLIAQINAHPYLQLSGLMGYEPHIVKLPGSALHWLQKAQQRYTAAVHRLTDHFSGDQVAAMTLNCGGSPTYQLYNRGQWAFNELAAGSCLVKPTDFDIPTLADHQPASFIAAPVLKRGHDTQIPGINLGKLQAWWNPNKAQSFFTYGGYWKAKPESPKGLSNNALYGRSTNQEMYNGSRSIQLNVDDWIFLRPTQSEFVFLQFGQLVNLENGQKPVFWPILSDSHSASDVVNTT